MDSYNGLSLDDDIVDRIMTFCPTFGTLQSTILVSKAFHRVFQAHPKASPIPSTFPAVNIRCSRMAEACPEDHDPSVITAEEKETLQENSRLVAVLEDIYSLTNKDRTSKTSVLTSEESWRFRRAMYQLINKIRKQRTAMLSEYPTDDLRELHSAVKFLCSIFDSVTNAQSNVTEALLSTGPSGALRAWQDRSYHVLGDDIDLMFFEDDQEIPLFLGYFSLPLQNIWTVRNITPPKDDDPASTWILDQVNGANDTCSHCAAPGGLKLYTAASEQAALFPSPRVPSDTIRRLGPLPNHPPSKKNLKLNQTVAQPFYAATAHLVHSDALGPFLSDLFAFKPRTAPAFDNWDQSGSYCFMCFTKFLEEHLWIWFLEERIKGARWTPPEDCWYGWNCRTQIHKRSHAETKNHLCVPIKGDPA
ncbi:hypothetical protein B0H13DRAFT_2162289 [Mycena leptocephala]|nr:hypothetical protein B0H13DRAFT_2162289 [Mycena leptocephala]